MRPLDSLLHFLFRSLTGYETYVYTANLGNATVTIDLTQFDTSLPSTMLLKIKSLDSKKKTG